MWKSGRLAQTSCVMLTPDDRERLAAIIGDSSRPPEAHPAEIASLGDPSAQELASDRCGRYAAESNTLTSTNPIVRL